MNPLSRRAEFSLFALILVAAAVLRLGWPGLTEFKADEARLLTLALDMAQGQGLALRGISSSVGAPNFPMSVWLYALPVWLWPHVYAATLFTGLLNVLAVAAGYWFVRRYWGGRAALAAMLLLAVSPWAVIFSRKIWAQNLLPLFVMGWGISAALAFVERRPSFITLHFLFLAVAAQTHLAAAALGPVTAVLLLVFRRRVRWRWVLVAVLLALLTAVPFLVYLWQNKGGAAWPGGVDFSGAIDLKSLRFTNRLSLGSDIHSLVGPTALADYRAQVPDMTAVQWLWGVLIAGGILVMIHDLRLMIKGRSSFSNSHHHSSINDRRTEVGLIVLLWLMGPPLFFLWHNTPVFLHYFIATLPAQYIAAGVAFDKLIGRLAVRNRWGAGVSWGVLVGTAVLQVWLLIGLLFFVGRTATPGGFGVPVARKLAAVRQAKLVLAETNSYEVLIVGEGESPRLDEFPAVYGTLLRDVPHRFVGGSQSALFPAASAVILADGTAAVLDLYMESAVRHHQIPLRPGEASLHVLALPGAAVPLADNRFDPPFLLANWVNLLGYDEPALHDEGTAVWRIHWRTGDNPDTVDYHFFNHLLDGVGRRVSQVDAPAFAPGQWRAGDVIVSHFQLPWPGDGERPFTMRTGMYHYPSLEPVLLLDVAGNPYADAAEIELDVP